jgi:hypothetical protein
MKKIYILLIIFSSIIIALNAQTIIHDGFESGSFTPLVSFQTVGSYNSAPGIVENTNFGSTRAFSFGRSSCSSSCVDSYKTTLIITFPTPTFVDSIKWKEMEIPGNWGSQGQVFLDDVVFAGATLGAMPVNSGVPDASPQLKNLSVNQTVTTIKFVVNDITNASEIILDDLQIKYTSIPKIVGYEYWFNNDYANKTTTMVTSTQQLMINQTIPTTGLIQGINTFNFRSLDDLGKYSSVVSHFFYKTSVQESNPSPQIVAYQYWIDTDFSTFTIINASPQNKLNINSLIELSTLANGLHCFNIQFKDANGSWSSILSHFFYKTPINAITQNKISAYRYWFDDNFEQAVKTTLPTPLQQLNLVDNLDATRIPKGAHTVHFQFADSLGQWSSVTTDSITKIAFPIADFTYSLIENCDSTIVSFNNKSMDADSVWWTLEMATPTTTNTPSIPIKMQAFIPLLYWLKIRLADWIA